MGRRSGAGLVCIGLALSYWGGACERQTPTRGVRGPADQSAPPTPDVTTDPGRLQAGDRWLDLRIEALDLRPETVDSFGWSGRVRFSGAIRLSGRYQPHPSYPEVQELCFYPDSSSAERLPRLPNDVRTSWFCFSNQEQAQAELAPLPTTGEATIVIGGYDYLYEHTDTYNTARLQEVVSRS